MKSLKPSKTVLFLLIGAIVIFGVFAFKSLGNKLQITPIKHTESYITDSVFGLSFMQTGFVDENYNTKLEHNYSICRGIYKGYAIVQNEQGMSYINNKGENLFGVVFEEANRFIDSVAVVKYQETPYYLHCTGYLLENPGWTRLRRFSDGLAGVMYKKKWGFINTQGNLVIPNKYSNIMESFKNGFAFVEDEHNLILIDKYGSELLSRSDYAFAYTIYDNKYISVAQNFTNENGQEEYLVNILTFENKYLFDNWNKQIGYLGNNLFSLNTGNGKEDMIVHANGDTISDIGAISYKYDKFFRSIKATKDSIIIDPDGGSNTKIILYNYIDTLGKLKLPYWYSEMKEERDGLFLLLRRNYLNSEASKLILSKDYYNYVDSNLKLISDVWFNGAYNFSEGFAKITINDPGRLCCGKAGYIDKNGIIVIPPQFSNAYSFSNGLALTKKTNGAYQYIKSNGEVVFEIDVYDANSFSHDLALTEFSNNNFGYINKKGEKVLSNYSDAKHFEERPGFSFPVATVSINGKYGLINKQGDWLIDTISSIPVEFYSDIARVCVNDTFRFIKPNGEWAIDGAFFQAGNFVQGKSSVMSFPDNSDERNEYYQINKEGKEIIKNPFYD